MRSHNDAYMTKQQREREKKNDSDSWAVTTFFSFLVFFLLLFSSLSWSDTIWLFNSLSTELPQWWRKGNEQKKMKIEQPVNKAPWRCTRRDEWCLTSFSGDSLAVMIHLLTYLNRNHFLSSVFMPRAGSRYTSNRLKCCYLETSCWAAALSLFDILSVMSAVESRFVHHIWFPALGGGKGRCFL